MNCWWVSIIALVIITHRCWKAYVHPSQVIENQAHNELHALEFLITQYIKDSNPYLLEPVVKHLVKMFGSYGNPNAEKALNALILINAKTPHEKLIPEYLHAFS
jgi:hypothetical protein